MVWTLTLNHELLGLAFSEKIKSPYQSQKFNKSLMKREFVIEFQYEEVKEMYENYMNFVTEHNLNPAFKECPDDFWEKF